MQKLALLFCLVSLFETVAASEELSKSDVEKLSEIINHSTIEMIGPIYPQCSDSDVLTIGKIYQQCVEKLCGSADSFENYNEYLNNFVQLTSESLSNIPKEFQARFRELAIRESKDEREGVEQLINALNKDKIELTASPIVHKLSYLSGFMGLIAFNPDFTIAGIDQEMLETYSSEISEKEQKWIIDAVKEMGFFNNLGTVLSDPKAYFTNKHPNVELKEALLKEATRALNSTEKFKKENPDFIKSFPTFFDEFEILPLIEKLSRNKVLFEEDLMDIAMTINGIDTIIPIVSTPENYPLINSVNIDIKDIAQRFNIKQSVKERLEELSPVNVKYHADLISQSCYASYLMSNALPTNNELKKFEKKIVHYKSDFKSSVLNDFSKHSSGKLGAVVDQLKFNVPKGKESFEEYMNTRIDRIISDNNSYLKQREKIPSASKKVEAILSVYDYMNSEARVPLLSDLEDLCDEEGISPHLSDATNTISGNIFVSWQSIKLPFGKSVIFHEIGHNIYQKLKTEKVSSKSSEIFKKSTKCLNTTHPELSGDSSSSVSLPAGGSFTEMLYTEEDFADTVAAKAIKTTDQSFACHFLSQVDYNYENLKTQQYEFSSLINEYSFDVHSSNFFRTLHLDYLNTGEHPKACSEFLKQTNTISPIKDCSLN